jgi:putative ABC transport system permease protein
MLLDNIRLSVRNLRHRPKRSWLTIVGILIGVAAVVALVSLGQGMQRSITQEFEAFGYNVVMIAGHGEHRLGMGALLGAHTFQLDLAPIKNIPGVEAVGGVLVKTPYISAGRREGYLLTWGIAPELMQSFSNYYKPALGRSLKPGERQTAVLGSTIAQDLGLAVGDTFVIETLEFEVVGILEKRADPDVNYAIMIPIATLQELFGEGDKLSLVLIRTAQHGTPATTSTPSPRKSAASSESSAARTILTSIRRARCSISCRTWWGLFKRPWAGSPRSRFWWAVSA